MSRRDIRAYANLEKLGLKPAPMGLFIGIGIGIAIAIGNRFLIFDWLEKSRYPIAIAIPIPIRIILKRLQIDVVLREGCHDNRSIHN
jgi:hypothetical protein